MPLEDKIASFCNTDGDFFTDLSLTNDLVVSTWRELQSIHITPGNYSTVACLMAGPILHPTRMWNIENSSFHKAISIEDPYNDTLLEFLSAQDLSPASIDDLQITNIKERIKNAIDTIWQIPSIAKDIEKLVTSIIVLHSNDPQIDISYSHPNIPFTIFATLCKEKNEISNLRGAESIIHEAMHLKLSMIESITPLVDSHTSATHYSPWRLSPRPVQGVLHGLFVFRVLYDFYTVLLGSSKTGKEALKFISDRQNDIRDEIQQVVSLAQSATLTPAGKDLVSSLLNVKLA